MSMLRGTCAVVSGLITVTLLSGCFLTRGTTEATGELTDATGHVIDATTDLTSPDGSRGTHLTKEQRLRAFAAYNFENLSQDIARGQGEYLASFTTLLDVPVQRHEALFRLVQQSYPVLSSGKADLRKQTESLIDEFQRLSTRLE